MVLIVNGVTRFTVEQTLESNRVANIIDVRIDTTGTITDRDTAIQDQAEIIFREWVNHLLQYQVDDLTLDAVRWVDLDSATGSTGEVVTDGVNSAPEPGLATGDPLPGNTAGLIGKQLESAGRGRRSGRMYLAGLQESITETSNGNRIGAAVVSGMNTSLASFLAAVNQSDGGTPDYSSAMCVVHVTSRDADGRPLTGTSSDVGALVLDGLLATQRRRLRR